MRPLDIPGTVARTTSFIVVIANPSLTLSTVHAAFVSIFVGGEPACSSPTLSAMLKQAASAAASSSSGFVPGSSPNRVPNEYVPPIFPLAPEKLPFPFCRPPSQTADAFRVGMLLSR